MTPFTPIHVGPDNPVTRTIYLDVLSEAQAGQYEVTLNLWHDDDLAASAVFDVTVVLP